MAGQKGMEISLQGVDFHQEIFSAEAEEASMGKERKGLMEKNKTWRESSLLMGEREGKSREKG